ncbi:MAG: hypothetical protein IJK97_12835 [Thermoguttaceae bacterium]|nr:hypothetical protein [Thermoguttaceae bacterium]MBR0193294.1 hypothetical protein [Thermoguttaceae bacterium]
MRQIFLNISLLLAAVILVGCEEKQTETTDEAPAQVTARLCHIARVGNLAEIPDELWENEKKPESAELPEGLDFSGKMEEAPVSKAVGDEIDPDILAIVESTARESSSEEGIQKAQEKEKELDLAIEMVEESQKTEAEVEELFKKDSKKNNGSAEDEEGDENEEVDISMGNDDETSLDVKETAPSKKKTKSGKKTKTEVNTENEEVEEAENLKEETGEKTEPNAEKPAANKSGVIEEEMNRQAEAFLEVLKNTPEEVREEMKKANFQNVTYRLVKIPGVILQEGVNECLIVRTMEYTGTNLARDYQMLNLSKTYSSWLMEQEKYLEIMTLDSLHHETWVEVPEFWSSTEE